MDDSQRLCLKWSSFPGSVLSVFDQLRSSGHMIDLTLCCGGRQIKAHRLLLCACSPYFREILQDNPCQHPVIFVTGCHFTILCQLIEFIYCGQVHVEHGQLEQLLKLARQLHVEPLMDADAPDFEADDSILPPPEHLKFHSQRQQPRPREKTIEQSGNEKRPSLRTLDPSLSRSVPTPKRRRLSSSPLTSSVSSNAISPLVPCTGVAPGLSADSKSASASVLAADCTDLDSCVGTSTDVGTESVGGSNPRSVGCPVSSGGGSGLDQSLVKQECDADDTVSGVQQLDGCGNDSRADDRDEWNSFNHHIACKSEHWMLSDSAAECDPSAVASGDVYEPSPSLTTPPFSSAPLWLTAALGSGPSLAPVTVSGMASSALPPSLYSASLSPTTATMSSYSCQDCGRVFRSEASMNNHRSMHRGSTRCPHCGMVYSTISAMRRHVRMSHELSGAALNVNLSAGGGGGGGNMGGPTGDPSVNEAQGEDSVAVLQVSPSVELVD